MVLRGAPLLRAGAALSSSGPRRPRHRFTLSTLLRPVNVLPHRSPDSLRLLEDAPVEVEDAASSAQGPECKSHRLLVDQGIIRPVTNCPGMFHYLPLAVR